MKTGLEKKELKHKHKRTRKSFCFVHVFSFLKKKLLFMVARGLTACLKTYHKHVTSTSSSVGFKNSFSLKYFEIRLLRYSIIVPQKHKC